MDHTMADGEHAPAAVAAAQPGGQRVERAPAIAHRCVEVLLDQRLAGGVFRAELRRRADPFDLTACLELPGIAGPAAIHAELQARRTGVEDERVVHGHAVLVAARRACAASTATAQLAMRDRTLSARLV